MRGKTEFVERIQVVTEREALFGTADDGTVDGLRQALLGSALCDCDGFEPRVPHGSTAYVSKATVQKLL